MDRAMGMNTVTGQEPALSMEMVQVMVVLDLVRHGLWGMVREVMVVPENRQLVEVVDTLPRQMVGQLLLLNPLMKCHLLLITSRPI